MASVPVWLLVLSIATKIHEFMRTTMSAMYLYRKALLQVSLLLMSVRLPLQHPQQQQHLPGESKVQDC